VLGYRWPPNAPKPSIGADPMIDEVKTAAGVGATATAVGGAAAALPLPPVEHLAWLGGWKDALMQMSDFVGFAAQHWMIVAGSLTAWTAYRIWSLRKMEILSGAFWKG
jgi:hypothetical protein